MGPGGSSPVGRKMNRPSSADASLKGADDPAENTVAATATTSSPAPSPQPSAPGALQARYPAPKGIGPAISTRPSMASDSYRTGARYFAGKRRNAWYPPTSRRPGFEILTTTSSVSPAHAGTSAREGSNVIVTG